MRNIHKENIPFLLEVELYLVIEKIQKVRKTNKPIMESVVQVTEKLEHLTSLHCLHPQRCIYLLVN